jgi:hypothetical protein
LRTSIVTPIPSANQPHTARRIAASALGVRLCSECRPLVCQRCGVLSQCHTFGRRPGGGVWVTVVECHSDADCDARQGVQA